MATQIELLAGAGERGQETQFCAWIRSTCYQMVDGRLRQSTLPAGVLHQQYTSPQIESTRWRFHRQLRVMVLRRRRSCRRVRQPIHKWLHILVLVGSNTYFPPTSPEKMPGNLWRAQISGAPDALQEVYRSETKGHSMDSNTAHI